VNQWTLLVGAIPITYAISLGAPRGLPLDDRQTEELVLTSAQSLLAALLIADLRFGRLEAIALAILFGAQLFFPSTAVRWGFIALYMAIFAGLLVAGPPSLRRAFFALVLGRPRPDPGGARPSPAAPG
jgi:cation:H+ antiporter